MQMTDIPFGATDWSTIEQDEHKGERGFAYWRTRQVGTIRVRMVEYTPEYLADHWCTKGHILLCIKGELHTELADGRTFTLTPGMSYQVADNAEPHRLICLTVSGEWEPTATRASEANLRRWTMRATGKALSIIDFLYQ
jgi:hypothetical protein